jgi:hypothetical protein
MLRIHQKPQLPEGLSREELKTIVERLLASVNSTIDDVSDPFGSGRGHYDPPRLSRCPETCHTAATWVAAFVAFGRGVKRL